MFRASNESLFCLQFNPSKNNNFKVPPIDRVLDSLNLDPEGLGGKWSKKTTLTLLFAQNTPWGIKLNFKNLLPSIKSSNRAQKRGPLS
jgi:hypothetical protein